MYSLPVPTLTETWTSYRHSYVDIHTYQKGPGTKQGLALLVHVEALTERQGWS